MKEPKLKLNKELIASLDSKQLSDVKGAGYPKSYTCSETETFHTNEITCCHCGGKCLPG